MSRDGNAPEAYQEPNPRKAAGTLGKITATHSVTTDNSVAGGPVPAIRGTYPSSLSFLSTANGLARAAASASRGSDHVNSAPGLRG